MLLYCPIDQQELDLIAAANWLAFPPRLPEQPFFYPVLHAAYATQIARDGNVPYYGIGYVVRFAVEADYAATFPVQNVGGPDQEQLWVPAAELADFNQHLLGQIEVVAVFSAP
ncbi:hypothetical protein E5J99_14465 [Hymenobacter elongatus]|uniref:ADP-ribosylation/crystallin J1 n=1 Tax=Hymenobacter elongatus TaxID=877208 RepID=A0A4Z0PIB5_9BACT|nr:hypothetical protein E5J99_14465 [Hymenobacter elongatus]